MRFPLGLLYPTSLIVLMVGCQMPNPEFDARGGSETLGQDTLAGDGDGDPSTGDGDGDPSTGDGDGDPNTGDGDGDPSTGDGDGDPTAGDGDGDPNTGDGDGDGDGDPVECLPGQMFCGDGCIDTLFDKLNCGGCGSMCVDGQLCAFGMCQPRKLVFVTQTKFTGNFLGIDAANQNCNNAAAQALLPIGDYRAWLSDAEKSPSTTFETEGVFVLRMGAVVAYSLEDLTDGELMHAINETEFGMPATPSPACNDEAQFAVWTGTNAFGAFAQPNCSGWANGGNITTGRTGNSSSADATWSDSGCLAQCNTLLPIYCVQQ